MTAAKGAGTRVGQAVVLLIGALVLERLVQKGSTPFYWTPLIVGVTYLGAAAVGGRRGGHWPTACVFLGWGAVVAWTGASRPADIDIAGAYLLGAGLGVMAGGLLPRIGFVVDAVGLGAALAAGGLLLALTPRDARLDDAQTYAAFLAVVAVVNVALAAVAARGGTRTARA